MQQANTNDTNDEQHPTEPFKSTLRSDSNRVFFKTNLISVIKKALLFATHDVRKVTFDVRCHGVYTYLHALLILNYLLVHSH